MEFVTPWLAIGTREEAANAALRRAHGISAVLSLLAVDFAAGDHHLTLPVADRVALPAADIRAATAFIEAQRQRGRTTLVHCQMGISRSPALAACHLHEYAGRTLAAALDEVRRARPIADPHPALLESMAAHYLQPHALPVDLSANENPLGASPLAQQAMRSLPDTLHRYPDRQGAALRRRLARQLGGGPEQVVLGNGSSELLDLAARAFLAPGDSAIIAPPCFPSYRSAVLRAHGRLIEVPTAAADDFACRLERLAAAIDGSTRLIYIGNPNNPTGVGVAPAALSRFIEHLPADVVVLLDEAYRDYHPAADELLADGPALVRAGHRLLVVRSFSKLHGLAGLRIGYGFGPAALIAALEAQRPPYNTSAVAQAAALAALDDGAHQTASRQLAASGLQQLVAGLRGLGLYCHAGRGNFVLAACAEPAPDAGAIAAELASAGILVKPGAAFGLPGHLRISAGLPAENSRLLERLGDILQRAAAAHPDNAAHQGR